jgi:choline dehydrogenase-like flavoprotein
VTNPSIDSGIISNHIHPSSRTGAATSGSMQKRDPAQYAPQARYHEASPPLLLDPASISGEGRSIVRDDGLMFNAAPKKNVADHFGLVSRLSIECRWHGSDGSIPVWIAGSDAIVADQYPKGPQEPTSGVRAMFDYVIAGGGSAGCVLASRLSENPNVKVCLLEAGGKNDSWMVRTPIGVALMLPTRFFNNWAFETVPQPGLNGRKGYQPRGKGLGGSSATNAMVYIRGHRWDYDHWASLGNTGWAYDDVLPYFRKAEGNEALSDAFHGAEGPLNVANLRTDNPFPQHFLDAARECQLPSTSDFNGAQQEGVGVYQVTQKDGTRWSAARAYLEPHRSRPNLTVVTGARATRILLDGKRATGISYRENGAPKQAMAAREVIVCNGAFGSPQLLMLSGIGDAEELGRHGIPVAHHLPGVGRNLQDHIDYVLSYRSKSRDLFGISLRGNIRLAREIWRYRREGRGMVTSNFAEAGGFLRTDPALDIPDVQLHFVVGIVDDHSRKLHLGHGFSCHVCLLRPHSRGTVMLAGPDPLAAPRIDPRFFEDARDLEAMVKAFHLTRRIMDAPALKRHVTSELYTADVKSDDDIRQELRQRSDTVYHPVGTCRMGTDALAVVDPSLRVHGVAGLRVVDASIMPTVVGGNTNAPTIMIAEKAADMIKTASARV